jgi:hypothetical protein
MAPRCRLAERNAIIEESTTDVRPQNNTNICDLTLYVSRSNGYGIGRILGHENKGRVVEMQSRNTD